MVCGCCEFDSLILFLLRFVRFVGVVGLVVYLGCVFCYGGFCITRFDSGGCVWFV